jgi:hypothetical protein
LPTFLAASASIERRPSPKLAGTKEGQVRSS